VNDFESKLRANNPNFPKKWSLFFARYRLLKEFSGVEFHTIKGQTARGYESALKLGLAHTALESLQMARPGSHAIAIKNKGAARLVRKLRGSQFEDFLAKTSTAPALKKRLGQMFASQNIMDLTPMVEATRNSVFHGSFTPYSAGFTKNADVRLLMNLSFHLILDAIDVEIRRLDIVMFDAEAP
jgi:hypothetical protein